MTSNSLRLSHFRNHILSKLFLLFVQTILTVNFWGCSNNSNKSNPTKGVFDDLFIVSESFVFESSIDNPIVSPAKGIAVTKDRVFIPDGLGNQIIVYDRHLKSVKSFGRRGQGPGEFIHPSQVIVKRNGGNIYVVDPGNFRLQTFDSSFNFEMSQSFSENIQQFYIESKNNGLRYWIVGPVQAGKNGYLLTKYDLYSNSVKHFYPYDTKGAIFYSWVSDMDEDLNIYIANIIESKIHVFDSNGDNIRNINLKGSINPTELFNKKPKNSNEQIKQIQEFNKKPSQIMSIKIFNELVFVTVAGNKNGKTGLFLDIYNKRGELIYFGIESPGLLLFSDEKNLYFMEILEENQYTKIIGHVAEMRANK